ncbi:hypothetical protein GCM10007067_15340 [Lysobacter bugurensis]|uniref:DUF4394 domain-containing protein n=2 Tax=Cognatilysobacter bugurensis TaxID=543356 RepID=A0A918T1W5_9GAMM|nr:hypothetical protein GCM10007067_15340 [Lysobacter bugurensis]
MTSRYGVLSLSAAIALGVATAFVPGTAIAAGGSVSPQSHNGLKVIGLTADQRLISFYERQPGSATNIGYVRGLSGDRKIIGIDYRVQNGKLYGVGNAGGIYLISPTTAAATKVSQLTVALQGRAFAADFNPAADRLRVVSDTGQNLRHDVNPGGATIVDGRLSYMPGVDALGITGAAYTNNDLNASTATTLFDIDFKLDQVVLQSPANAGTLAGTGKLSFDIASCTGFDAYSTVRNGMTVKNEGYAALRSSSGTTRFYKVDLLTGKTYARGTFAGENTPVDIAIPLNQL